MSYCLKCTALLSGDSQFCSKCGQDQCETVPAHHMKPGTLLEYRYWVGKALGEGGFGITYIGRDTKLDMTVAIKEYYPNGYVSRSNTISAAVETSYSADRKDFFEKGRERFLKEARILARFAGEPGVVNVRDFFEQNNTAYIVMEYLDGLTLKEYLHKNGTMPAQQVLQLLMPTMQVLQKIHAMDLIHRDISPDNIMLINGKVKLLDFGAARDVTAVGNKSLSVMLKPGYAPEEQYRSRGIQGTWTDVYAISATIYKCITGITPDDSTQRVFCDEVKTPSELGIKIDPLFEAALMKGMAVSQKDRYQSIGELLDGLNGAGSIAYETESRVVQENSEETVCIFDDDTAENSQIVTDVPAVAAPEDSSDALPVFIPVITNDGETVAIETEDDVAETEAPSIELVENTLEEAILESTEYDAPVMSEQKLDRENGEDIPEENYVFADLNDEITLGGTALATAETAEDDQDFFDDIEADDVDKFFDYDSKNEESEGYYNKYGEFIQTETSVETEQAKLPENKHRKVIAIGVLLLFVLFIFVIVFTSCEPKITREDIILYDSNGNIVDEINMAPNSTTTFSFAFADEELSEDYRFEVLNPSENVDVYELSPGKWNVVANADWTGTFKVETYIRDEDYLDVVDDNTPRFEFTINVSWEYYASEDSDTPTDILESTPVTITKIYYDYVTSTTVQLVMELSGNEEIIEKYFEYGTQIGNYTGKSLDGALTDLTSNTIYYYRAVVVTAAGQIMSEPSSFKTNTGLTIVTKASSGGTVTPFGSSEVATGDTLTVTVTPNNGYVINFVTVDEENVKLSKDGTYIFSNIKEDHILYAAFKPTSITADTNNEGGSSKPSNTTSTVTSKPSNTVSTVTSKPSSTTSETAKKVTVNFDSNGGTSYKSITVTVGGTYGTLPTPTKTGYSFNGWYTSSSGGTKVTNSTIVSTKTNHTLYAQWIANSYTYNIVCKSSNGTDLGTSTVTHKFGTTNSISAPNKTGYTKPSSQSVTWNSTSAKTITFIYTPESVSTSQTVKSGTWRYYDGEDRIVYSVKVEYRNRTASSVQLRFVWTNTLRKGYYGYTQYFNASANGVSTGKVTIVSNSAWASSSDSQRSKTAYSGWITVPVNTAQQKISLNAKFNDAKIAETSWSSTVTIPAY